MTCSICKQPTSLNNLHKFKVPILLPGRERMVEFHACPACQAEGITKELHICIGCIEARQKDKVLSWHPRSMENKNVNVPIVWHVDLHCMNCIVHTIGQAFEEYLPPVM